MLIAILSDIHANDVALEVCLAEAEALGAEQYVFLGDLVGYGPEPEGTVGTRTSRQRYLDWP